MKLLRILTKQKNIALLSSRIFGFSPYKSHGTFSKMGVAKGNNDIVTSIMLPYSLIRGCFTIGYRNKSLLQVTTNHLGTTVRKERRERKKPLDLSRQRDWSQTTLRSIRQGGLSH